MKTKQYRHKHKPYQMFCSILYGNFAWLRWEDALTFNLDTGPMARKLRVSNSRVPEYFDYLLRHRYLSRLEITRGQIRATIKPPKHWRVENG